MRGGYLTLFRLRGIPFRAHWSLPLLPLLLSGGRPAPGLWLGVLLLVLLHEIGHALLVLRFRLTVVSIDLSGFGGRCVWAGNPTELERSAIAWGGVLAQAVVLIPTLLVLAIFGAPRVAFLQDLTDAFVRSNAMLIAFNLLPLPMFDGANAWRFFGHAWRAWRRRREWDRKLRGDDRPQTLRDAFDEAERNRRH